jgi:CheY-like chemotaxis protein
MAVPQPVQLERRVAVCVLRDDVLRWVVSEALEDCGFTALQAADRYDGFDFLHDHEHVDVIVLEAVDDDARWFRAVQRADPAHGRVPVVVIAGRDVDTRQLRASLVLRTPLSLENLVEGVQRLERVKGSPPAGGASWSRVAP